MNRHRDLLRKIIYFSISIVLFLIGMIIYGVILNSGEKTLEQEMIQKGLTELNNVSIYIDKSSYSLSLFSDSIMVKEYKAVFGKNSDKIKRSKNDFVTPFGKFKICEMINSSEFHKSLKLDYPNIHDASEAFKNSIITKEEFNAIIEFLKTNNCSYPGTKLGAEIYIHGIGDYNFIFKNLPFTFNWTNGSIAVSNESIEEIFSAVSIGTQVEVTN